MKHPTIGNWDEEQIARSYGLRSIRFKGAAQTRLALFYSMPRHVRGPMCQDFTQVSDSDADRGGQINLAVCEINIATVTQPNQRVSVSIGAVAFRDVISARAGFMLGAPGLGENEAMSKPITRDPVLSQGRAVNKTADEVLNSIIAHVCPTADISLWLTEVEPKAPGDNNWNAGTEPMPPKLLEPFLEILEIMRASDPIVEWGISADHNGSARRIYRRRGGQI